MRVSIYTRTLTPCIGKTLTLIEGAVIRGKSKGVGPQPMAIHGGASCRLAAVCLLLELLALQGGAGAAEPLVPAMFVFGDSMVDVGNNNFIDKCDISCKADYPHFGVDYLDHAPTGRFSNGYNLADHLGIVH